MTAMIIREGVIVATAAPIEALAEYARRRGVKVSSSTVLCYTNGFAALHVSYSDHAVGVFQGVTSGDLQTWANAQTKWPRAVPHRVSVPFLCGPEDEPATEVDAEDEPIPEPRRMVRTRPGVKRITRTRPK